MKKDHFLGKSVREHLAEEQVKSFSSGWDGTSVLGGKNAFFEALRDTVLVMGAFYYLLGTLSPTPSQLFAAFLSFGGFFSLWRGFRTAIQAWTYLKKVHRIAYEERCEILANREQEREELVALYSDKGFSGSLLDKVVDVLMADHERLLQVMLQEELGLKLISIDHPLHTAVWAFFGSLASVFLSWGVLIFVGPHVSWVFLSLLAGVASSFLSYKERNIRIRAFVWATGASAVAFQALFFLLEISQ